VAEKDKVNSPDHVHLRDESQGFISTVFGSLLGKLGGKDADGGKFKVMIMKEDGE
jgi:hypothetical protein